jgi:choline transport protein
MTVFVALLATAFNTFAAKRLPMFEGMILYLHILLWFGVSFITSSPRATRADIHSTISRFGSWRLRYQPLKCSASSKTGLGGQLQVQQ